MPRPMGMGCHCILGRFGMWLEKKRRPNIWWAGGARVDAENGISSLVKRVEVGHRPKAVEESVETRTRAETGPSWKEAILGGGRRSFTSDRADSVGWDHTEKPGLVERGPQAKWETSEKVASVN